MITFCDKCRSIMIDGKCSAECATRKKPSKRKADPIVLHSIQTSDPITVRRRRPKDLSR
jgi:hypothetical protein